MDIPARFDEIRDRMETSMSRVGREPGSVRLVAVSKTRTVAEIAKVVEAGATDIGENRVQEAESKMSKLQASPRWHLVGHLQKNKARKAVELFDVIWMPDDPRKPANVIVYLCRPVGGELRAGSDASEAAWFRLDELPGEIGFHNAERILARLPRRI